MRLSFRTTSSPDSVAGLEASTSDEANDDDEEEASVLPMCKHHKQLVEVLFLPPCVLEA